MGPGETIALVAVVGGLIAVTILVGTIFKRIMSFKERAMELKAARMSENASPNAAQVQQLEQRVRVLERIATDKGAVLAAQIEELRAPGVAPQFETEEHA